MNFKKTLTLIIACMFLLTGKNAISEGMADRMNEVTHEPISAELLIQHINTSFGATAAGGHVMGTKMNKKLNTLKFSYQGLKHQPQFKKLTASEYRKEIFGSN